MSWRPVGAVLPTGLRNARLELHYATQLVSAPGATLLPPTPDHRHTNLAWNDALGILAGRPVGSPSRSAALVFESLELVVLEDGVEHATLSLAGSTVEGALEWLSPHFVAAGRGLTTPVHAMPAHDLGCEGVFSEADPKARAELAHWFANATGVVRTVSAEDPLAEPVRCWPHHFDVASLIVLDPNEEPELARTIGVGFSPGDTAYAQPYFYVTVWPVPELLELPPLEGGATWHTEGWTGAVLTGERVVSTPPEAQRDAVVRFLRDAVGHGRSMLGV